MKKFFNNLLNWWGWMCCKNVIYALIMVFLPITISILWTILSPSELRSKIIITTFFPSLAWMAIAGIILSKTIQPSKNLRVAICMAEKMISNPQYKNDADLLSKLIRLIGNPQFDNAHKYLAETLGLIEKRDNAFIENSQNEAFELQSEIDCIEDSLPILFL